MRLTVSQVHKARPKARYKPNPLHARRIDSGLCLRDVARHSGVSTATIYRAETGKSVDVRTALKLARFYETTVEGLFGWMVTAGR